MDDFVEEPKTEKPKPPLYVAALVPSRGANGEIIVHIAAVLVTGAVVEYHTDDHAVQLTDLGRRMRLALVNPAHFTHTDIARTLDTMNATDGRDRQTGLNVTRVVDTNTPIHQISYNTARQLIGAKHYL